ncbi:hypothetical protein [Lacinutrix sp.]|uniref:hypothetical protein n=1 Tax=Lacinutrix sp. TaxID=1937692 RepID=UPI0025C64CFB|nr:hypothetical protein [Lacinutrix sp.]
MFKTINRKFYIVYALNIIIAFAYYIGNRDANYSELSSDIQNIIPVAQKFDDPSLFKKDLYLNDINNVKYYTPFYVQSLRFIAKFTNADYVQAINVMNTICHLLFGVLWFFLMFRFVPDFWIALLVSFLLRGIVWLPGFEIWGITDLWAMMPRTLYITLFPIPFLVLNKSFRGLVLSAFFIGLVFNFHPITGLGGILLYLTFLLLMVFIFKMKDLVSTKNIVSLIFALILGMLPFILTYFGKTSSSINYDMNAFKVAFDSRIPQFFSQPVLYIKDWLHFKTLFYIVPIIAYFIFPKKEIIHFKRAKLIIVLTLVLVILPSISVYVEQFINSVFGLNLRLSFQLIRAQKVAIIPSFFAMVFVLQIINTKVNKQFFLPLLFSIYFLILIVSKALVFNNVPFVGDDIVRLVLPNNLCIESKHSSEILDVDKMALYISKNTNKDAVIFGGHHYRGAAKRSVVLDSKGASMIIEGNPSQFIQWKKDQLKLANATSIEERLSVLKSLKVNYIVSKNNFPLEVVHIEGVLNLYKLQ